MQAGAPGEALPMLEQAAAGARAARDDDLFVLAGLGRGRCLVALGRTAEALATLDEIMVYVVADHVAPHVVGLGVLHRDLPVHGTFRHSTRRRMDASAHRLVRRAIRS